MGSAQDASRQTSPTARTRRRRSHTMPPASWSSGETSVLRGLRRRQRPASGRLTPGDKRRPRGRSRTMQLSAADKAAVDKVCAAAKRCVIVIVSGRPLILDPGAAQRGQRDSWRRGCRAARAPVWPTTCSGHGRSRASCPCPGRGRSRRRPINVGDPPLQPAVSLRLRPSGPTSGHAVS